MSLGWSVDARRQGSAGWKAETNYSPRAETRPVPRFLPCYTIKFVIFVLTLSSNE